MPPPPPAPPALSRRKMSRLAGGRHDIEAHGLGHQASRHLHDDTPCHFHHPPDDEANAPKRLLAACHPRAGATANRAARGHCHSAAVQSYNTRGHPPAAPARRRPPPGGAAGRVAARRRRRRRAGPGGSAAAPPPRRRRRPPPARGARRRRRGGTTTSSHAAAETPPGGASGLRCGACRGACPELLVVADSGSAAPPRAWASHAVNYSCGGAAAGPGAIRLITAEPRRRAARARV